MKIRWHGPRRYIPDLGLLVEPGESYEIPAKTNLGGKGRDWKPIKSAEPKKSTAKETD